MLCQKHYEESNAGNGFKSDIASFDRKGAISKPGEHSKKPASSVHFDITFAHFAQNIVRNQVWKCCFLLKWQRLARPTPTETGQTGCKTRSTQNGHTSPHHLTGMHKGLKKYSTYYNIVLKNHCSDMCEGLSYPWKRFLLAWLPFQSITSVSLSLKIEFVSSFLSLSNLGQDL